MRKIIVAAAFLATIAALPAHALAAPAETQAAVVIDGWWDGWW